MKPFYFTSTTFKTHSKRTKPSIPKFDLNSNNESSSLDNKNKSVISNNQKQTISELQQKIDELTLELTEQEQQFTKNLKTINKIIDDSYVGLKTNLTTWEKISLIIGTVLPAVNLTALSWSALKVALSDSVREVKIFDDTICGWKISDAPMVVINNLDTNYKSYTFVLNGEDWNIDYWWIEIEGSSNDTEIVFSYKK